MLVVVPLLPLSLAMDDSDFDNVGGGGGPAAAAAAAPPAVAAVDDRDGIQWRRWWGSLMAAVAFDGIQRRQR